MVLMTGAQYRESLSSRRPMNVYFLGEKLDKFWDHPIIKASINSCALTYELAEDPEYKDLMTVKSSLTGDTINRFCHLHQSTKDLEDKVKMQRVLGQKCGTCFQRCVGMDAMNAVYLTTREIDLKHGTGYHDRFVEFVRSVERGDLVIDGCMTDVKGDRGKRPAAQDNPDAFVRVIERKNDGVVIRGCKAHQTGAINSHEILIMPTATMRAEEKDYSICCSIPADEKGITYIYGRQSCDLRKLDESNTGDIDCGNPVYGGQECLVVFDNVFIPDERIYMDGEYDFTGMLVESFAGYHRQSYGGCKVGVGDVLIGATALVAEYNGVERASHVKDKLVEMNHLNETLFACGIACSACGKKTKAGNYLIDLLLSNVCKQNVTRFPYEMARLSHDIAGGLVGTLPSAKDFRNEATGDYLDKYLRGVDSEATINRAKIVRLIENLTLGRAAIGYLVESMHGAGSPQAQRIMINRLANLDEKKELAKDLARIE
ncbi:MAG: 4-hydroxyphenylacetate 3-hydroxylase family protein [Candidatus Hodarchaeota archaeon]